MPDSMEFEYFFGEESTQFSFFKVPCQLITNPQFRQLSNDSKLLDRMSLSARNGWYDEQGRVGHNLLIPPDTRLVKCKLAKTSN